VEDISAGRANISVFDVVRKDEFGHLSRAFYGLSQRREQAELELHRLATTDVLTGLNNRRMFDAFLPQALARAARSGQTVGLAILDIDHFKTINDTLGHPAGDQVLIEFSRRLTGAVRTTDTVARLAGDEFVIVFEQLSTAPEMTLLGEKILDAMRPPFTLGTCSARSAPVSALPSPRPCVHHGGRIDARRRPGLVWREGGRPQWLRRQPRRRRARGARALTGLGCWVLTLLP
jgi:GGDEF domain-containing protein